jgi:putative DNA primase/helicase
MTDIDDAVAAARAQGLDVTAESIIVDGKIRRCAVIGGNRGNLDGAYRLYPDPPIAGWFQNWHGDLVNWCSVSKNDVPPAKWAEIQAQFAAEKKKRESDEKQERADARARDKRRWNAAAKEYEHHLYIDKKGILPHGTRVDDVDGEPRILVPVLDIDGELHGLQRIAPDNGKLFTKKTAVTGHFFVIGEMTGKPGERVVQAEGFATCAAIHESTGYPVVVSFDCGNQ